MQTDRLKPGFLLFPGPDGGWCLHGPGERFIRLREEPERIARLARHLSPAAANGVPAEPVTDDLRELLAAFRSYGLLDESGEEPDAMKSSHRVRVTGEGPVSAQVRELLAVAAPGVIAETGASDPDLLIACAGWLPDEAWCRLDEECLKRGIAWHRVYHEGLAIHLGPLSIPGTTASYADARARRLAAAPFPDELEALWKYLDGDSPPPPPALSEAAAAVIAGLLAEDVLAFLAGRTVPSLGHAVEVDLVSLACRRHPVLPVPRGALTEGAA